MNLFSKRLHQLRDEKGLTQNDLVKLLEKKNITTSAQNISYWEKGREPNYSTLIALSKIFEVDINYLLGETPFKNMKEEKNLDGIIDVSNNADEQLIRILHDLKSTLSTFDLNSKFYMYSLSILESLVKYLQELHYSIETTSDDKYNESLTKSSFRGQYNSLAFSTNKSDKEFNALINILNIIHQENKDILMDKLFNYVYSNLKEDK